MVGPQILMIVLGNTQLLSPTNFTNGHIPGNVPKSGIQKKKVISLRYLPDIFGNNQVELDKKLTYKTSSTSKTKVELIFFDQ